MFGGSLLWAVLLTGRLLYVQVGIQGRYGNMAMDVRLRPIPVGHLRGNIVSRSGAPLAVSETSYAAYAVPSEVRSPLTEAAVLGPVLGRSPEWLAKRLTQSSSFVWLKRRLPTGEAQALRRMKLAGVGLAPESQRVYPQGDLAAQVLGFAGIDNQGLDGLELTYEKVLRGRSGQIQVEFDARGQQMPHAIQRYRPPVPGNTLRLSLSAGIQRLTQKALQEAMAETQAKAGSILVMDPRTGGILAMANWPTYNANQYPQAPPESRRNQIIGSDMPPGSTFKPVTVAAALAAGAITPATSFYDPGSVRVDGVPISCWKDGGHGSQTLAQVVANSCNVGFVRMGLDLGVQRFYHYLHLFHLTGPTGIDLPGEAGSIMPPAKLVKPVDLATMSFGQTLAITPLSLLSAISAIANGGVWHTPHLVNAILGPKGQVLRLIGGPGRQIIPAAVAREVARMMAGVVAGGTGKNARISGYTVGGKTGTAQAVINGRYVPGKYIASFVGFAPATNPRIAVLVDINEPVGAYYGGQIAAPVFAKLASQILAYLRVPPDAPVQVHRAPDLLGMTPEAARATVEKAGIRLRILGGGNRIVGQLPLPGSVVPGGSEVLAFTGTEPPKEARVPKVTGMSVEEAAHVLANWGLVCVARGSGSVVRQEPSPGSLLGKGGVVRVSASGPA